MGGSSITTKRIDDIQKTRARSIFCQIKILINEILPWLKPAKPQKENIQQSGFAGGHPPNY